MSGPDPDGFYSATTTLLSGGDRYRFRAEQTKQAFPDPASRRQPRGPFGASEVVARETFRLKHPWKGRPLHGAICEAHVGICSPTGTLDDMRLTLDHAVKIGCDAVELMPLHAFAGKFGWGFDPWFLRAVHEGYGGLPQLAGFVDAAHERDLLVGVNVVLNHIASKRSALYRLAGPPHGFDPAGGGPWGPRFNVRQPIMRAFLAQTAIEWLEFADFLHIDAVRSMGDDSRVHFLEDLAPYVAAEFPGREKRVLMECFRPDPAWLRPDSNGRAAVQGVWNDNVYNALNVVVRKQTDAYFKQYARDPIAALGRALTEGLIRWPKPGERRGVLSPRVYAGVPLRAFISHPGTHDSLGFRSHGERLHHDDPIQALLHGLTVPQADPRAIDAMLILPMIGPQTPLIFAGISSPEPFPYFADVSPKHRNILREGHTAEMSGYGFKAFADPNLIATMPDPASRTTFESARLDWNKVDPRIDERIRRVNLMRRKEIEPYSDGVVVGPGNRFRKVGSTGLLCEWMLAGGRMLRVATNLGGNCLNIRVPGGNVVYSLQENVTKPGKLVRPWDIVVTIEAPRSAVSINQRLP
jgi:malto-oligosyltrehalose trehalohydrolase